MNVDSHPSVAGIWRRLAALMYESVLVFAIVFVAGYLFIALARETPTGWLRPVFYAYLIFICGTYFAFCWVRTGQTLAQKTWGLQVTRVDGALLGPGRAILRFLLGLPSIGSGIGLLWAAVDPDGQFLHDRLAGSRLVVSDENHRPDAGTG